MQTFWLRDKQIKLFQHSSASLSALVASFGQRTHTRSVYVGFLCWAALCWLLANVCFRFNIEKKLVAWKKECYRVSIGCVTNLQWISSQILVWFCFFLSSPVFSRMKSWAMCQWNHVASVVQRLVRPISTRCDRNVLNNRWNETLRRNCEHFIGSSSRKVMAKVHRNWSEYSPHTNLLFTLHAEMNWDFFFMFISVCLLWLLHELCCAKHFHFRFYFIAHTDSSSDARIFSRTPTTVLCLPIRRIFNVVV